MKALLIDDEPHNCELLENLLRFHLPDEVEVIGHAWSVNQAVAIICEREIELVFLDIQMPLKNGFELLKQFPNSHFELIFVTSFDQYALPAIQADAVAYLLKPIDVEELKKAVSKASKMRLLRGLTDQETSSATISFKIPVHDGDQVVYIPDNEIISLHAEGRYTRIIRQNGQQSMVARNLKTFEEMSCTKGSFCRICRSVILNMSFVQSYTKSEPFTVILKNGDVHEVSRRKELRYYPV